MAQQTAAVRKTQAKVTARDSAPEMGVRAVGALLALAVTAVHIADQGGITALNSPDWIGWGYRVIEVGGALTALTLVIPRPRWLGPAWLGWAAGVLLGTGPFVAYILSRSVGVPGDPGDVWELGLLARHGVAVYRGSPRHAERQHAMGSASEPLR